MHRYRSKICPAYGKYQTKLDNLRIATDLQKENSVTNAADLVDALATGFKMVKAASNFQDN